MGPNNNRPGARRKKLEYSWWARPAKSHLLTQSPAASGKDSYGLLAAVYGEMVPASVIQPADAQAMNHQPFDDQGLTLFNLSDNTRFFKLNLNVPLTADGRRSLVIENRGLSKLF